MYVCVKYIYMSVLIKKLPYGTDFLVRVILKVCGNMYLIKHIQNNYNSLSYNLSVLFIELGKMKSKAPTRLSDDYPDDGPIEEEGDYSTLASMNLN